MFVVAVFFEAKRDRAEQLKAALISHAALTRANEPGCQQFDVCEDPLDPASFFLYEVYDSEAAFHAHHEREHYAHFVGLVEEWVASKRVLTYARVDTAGTV